MTDIEILQHHSLKINATLHTAEKERKAQHLRGSVSATRCVDIAAEGIYCHQATIYSLDSDFLPNTEHRKLRAEIKTRINVCSALLISR
jgi:hypothetical protein